MTPKEEEMATELAILIDTAIQTSPLVKEALVNLKKAGCSPYVELSVRIGLSLQEDAPEGLQEEDLRDMLDIEEDEEEQP
jgi:hypothetical protein